MPPAPSVIRRIDVALLRSSPNRCSSAECIQLKKTAGGFPFIYLHVCFAIPLLLREVSREHLLRETQVPNRPSSSVVVVKGSLDQEGEGGGGQVRVGEAGRLSAKEWMLSVSKMDGTIQRFVVGGVDLVEPGSGICFRLVLYLH